METDRCVACKSDLVRTFPWVVPHLDDTKTINEQWVIQNEVNSNDYVTVFKVTATNSLLKGYMKAEYAKHRSNVLEMEMYILKQLENHKNFCTLYAYDTFGDIRYIVSGPIGRTLREVMRKVPEKHFTNGTILRVAIQCVDAISALHHIGYVHRNITPDNLIIDADMANARIVRIWHFATARHHLDENGEVRKPRSKIRCRGDYNYASVSVQEGKDSGRVDDLWSLMYTLSEFYNGRLPWRGHCSDHVLRWKQFMSMERLFRNAPYEIAFIMIHLRELNYEDEPNYEWIVRMLDTAMQRCDISREEQFDWQGLADQSTYVGSSHE